MFCRIAFAAVALVSGISVASADSFGPTDEVDGHPGVSYLDLIRHIVPDAAMVGETDAKKGQYPDAVGHTMVPLRHVDPSLAGPPPAELVAQHVEAWPFRADGEELLMIKLDLGQNDARPVGTTVLAMFDKDLNLVDAAEIALDSYVGNNEDPIAIGPDHDGMVFHSQYKDYYHYSLIYARYGRIEQAAVVQSNEPYECAETRGVWAEYAVAEAAGVPFWPVTVILHDNRTLDLGLSCSDLAGPSPVSVSATFQWDAAEGAYAGDRSELDALIETLPVRTEDRS